jgi:outer membrane immunogenic protein
MKKIILAFVAMTAAVVSATAADLPRNRRGKIPAQVYAPAPIAMNNNSGGGNTFWQGGYVGAHLGYGMGGKFSGNNGWSQSGAKGVLGGLQAGYDWQFGRVVAGVGADITLTSISASNAVARGDVDWTGSLRGRLGFLVTERIMLYGTAGLAAGGVKISLPAPVSERKTLIGSTFGVGAEYAFSQNLSALLEYRYTTLARGGYGSLANVSYDASFSSIRAGLNYRF